MNGQEHYNGWNCFDKMVELYGLDEAMSFCKLNAFKYLYRCKQKAGDDDLFKALTYLQKYFELKEQCVKHSDDNQPVQ